MNLVDRIKIAAAALFQRDAKAAMTFSRYGGIGGYTYLDDNFRINTSWPFLRNTQIDYRQEVGDLTQSSLVMAALNWAGRTLPQAMFRVYDLRGDSPQPLPKHPLHWRLRRPNPYFSGARMWKASAMSWILSGNVYWFKARNGMRVKELWWLPHWMVTPKRESKDDFVSYYEYRVDGVPSYLDPADVIHFRDGVDPADDMLGCSPIRALLREVFTDNEYSQYSALMARNSGVPPFGVIPKAQPGIRIDTQKIKDEVMRKVGGDERGKPVVFTGEVEVVKFGFSPRDMNLDMLRRVPEERLAGVLGIPAVVLGFGAGLERGTHENFAQAIEMAYEGFAVPLWEYFADELTAQLLPDYDSPTKGDEPTREVRADYSKVRALQEDQDALHKRLDESFHAGWLKRSEARAMAGLPVDAAIDDVYYLDITMSAGNPGNDSAPDGGAGGNNDQAKPRSRKGRIFKGLPDEYQRKADFDYSAIYVPLPPAIGDPILANGSRIPDDQLAEKGRETEPHVTILYGLHTKNPEDVRAVLGNEPPAALIFGRTGMFEGPDYDVLFVEVISPDLQRLNAKARASLEYTNSYTEYQPHATIAYLRPGEGRQYVGEDFLDGARFITDRLCFSTPDSHKVEIRLEGQRKDVKLKAMIGEVDMGTDEEARDWWERGAPDELIDLLDAGGVE
jgi:HK97 family phage portal protein